MPDIAVRFKTIIPKGKFDSDLLEDEIRSAMENKARPELRAEFYKTVDAWDTKVYFRGTIRHIRGSSLRLLIAPYGSGRSLYELVARGARPHVIEPRYASALRFQSGYRSASEVRWIGSRKKQRSGNWVHTQRVNHPGFEARDWDYEIADRYAPRFVELMRDAQDRFERKQKNAFGQ